MAQKEEAVNAVAGERASTREATVRRLEREQRRAALQPKGPGERFEEGSADYGQPSSLLDPKILKQSISPAGSSSAAPYSVKVPTSSSELAWYSLAQHSYSTIESARLAGIWSYPETSEQKARCAIYRALWEKGYYMGCGVKFGGDYLVYPGSSWLSPQKFY
jgi:tRNA-splicing endonuclease subunit Sen34